jgi:hypothetical protein
MNCRSGCPTKDHESWGACARDARIQIDKHGLAGHRNTEMAKDKRLSAYASLRKDGVQPASTDIKDIRSAEIDGGVPDTAAIGS